MSQPPSFINTRFPTHVCKLNKAIYGLKKTPRACYTKLGHALLGWGFQVSCADNSMFFLHTTKDVLILLIYIDDILVTGSDPHRVFSFASRPNATFAFRDLGRFHYFLGLEIIQAENSVHLNQYKYVHDLLQRTSMLESEFASTPGIVGQN